MNRRDAITSLFTVSAVAATSSASLLAADPHAAGHGAHGAAPGVADGPVSNVHLHFCGIHVAKNNPKFQIVTQHYCAPIGDMHQCLLYESGKKEARLLGVEYIISNDAYRGLPEAEKKFWHPHTYEVLGGGLIAPEMKQADEDAFMKGLLLTWGKTWHTWPDPSTPIPMGSPLLMWSLTGEGQDDPKVIAQRDKDFNVSIEEIRKRRAELIGYETPNVPFPTSLDTIGRQWTATGEDVPTKLK